MLRAEGSEHGIGDWRFCIMILMLGVKNKEKLESMWEVFRIKDGFTI